MINSRKYKYKPVAMGKLLETKRLQNYKYEAKCKCICGGSENTQMHFSCRLIFGVFQQFSQLRTCFNHTRLTGWLTSEAHKLMSPQIMSTHENILRGSSLARAVDGKSLVSLSFLCLTFTDDWRSKILSRLRWNWRANSLKGLISTWGGGDLRANS